MFEKITNYDIISLFGIFSFLGIIVTNRVINKQRSERAKLDDAVSFRRGTRRSYPGKIDAVYTQEFYWVTFSSRRRGSGCWAIVFRHTFSHSSLALAKTMRVRSLTLPPPQRRSLSFSLSSPQSSH